MLDGVIDVIPSCRPRLDKHGHRATPESQQADSADLHEREDEALKYVQKQSEGEYF